MTTKGSEPMMVAEARASAEKVRTLRCSWRRRRRILSRFSSVSARFPPVSRWTEKAMAMKLNSGRSMRSDASHKAVSSGWPSWIWSAMRRNSAPTGLPISRVTPMMVSVIGSPAFSPRTIKPTASGKTAMNLVARFPTRLRTRAFGDHRVMPMPAGQTMNGEIPMKKRPAVTVAPATRPNTTSRAMVRLVPVFRISRRHLSVLGRKRAASASKRDFLSSRFSVSASSIGGALPMKRSRMVWARRAIEPEIFGAGDEVRPQTARDIAALERAVRHLAFVLIGEEILRRDDVAFHADDLGHGDDAADTVAHAADLDDEIDRGGDLLADGARRQIDARHADHVLEAGQRLARPVGVDGRERAVMAGIHRLQHVHGFRAADFAQDDAVGAHAQRVLQKVADGDLALAFEVGRTRLEPYDVRLLQLQFGSVLDGDDALARVDHLRHGVEQGGLARARAARDQNIKARARGDLEHRRHRRGDVLLLGHHVERDALLGEFADRDRRPVERQGRRDDVDAATVLKARIDEGVRFVDAPADSGDDAGSDAHDMRVVAERDAGQLELAAALDIDVLGAVDHDVGHGLVREQWFEGSQPEHVVEQDGDELALLGLIELDALFDDDLAHHVGKLARELVAVQLGGDLGVDALQDERIDPRRRQAEPRRAR